MRFKNNFIQIKTVSIQLWRLNIFTPAHFCQRCRALILWQLIFIRETIIPIVRIKNKFYPSKMFGEYHLWLGNAWGRSKTSELKNRLLVGVAGARGNLLYTKIISVTSNLMPILVDITCSLHISGTVAHNLWPGNHISNRQNFI